MLHIGVCVLCVGIRGVWTICTHTCEACVCDMGVHVYVWRVHVCGTCPSECVCVYVCVHARSMCACVVGVLSFTVGQGNPFHQLHWEKPFHQLSCLREWAVCGGRTGLVEGN